MNCPLVTIGVPVYRGRDDLPVTLECLRTQTHPNLDILISVDNGDQDSAQACQPFLRRDTRFRMQVQPKRLGWAGNTDWTMRHRRGEFYIYQQHDDQVSPSYVADLVEAARRMPDASICFAKMQFSGLRTMVQHGIELTGPPIERALGYLKSLEHVPLRGLIRGSALASTSGLLLSDVDPFDSFGTENRLLAELALLGEFRFVPGPTYFKRMHGGNLHLKRENWSEGQKQQGWACLAAWMAEVIAPAGGGFDERRRLFDTVLLRFLVAGDRRRWLARVARQLVWTRSHLMHPIRVALDRLRSYELIAQSVEGQWMFYHPATAEQRGDLLRIIFDQLKMSGRLQPSVCFGLSWETLEEETRLRFCNSETIAH